MASLLSWIFSIFSSVVSVFPKNYTEFQADFAIDNVLIFCAISAFPTMILKPLIFSTNQRKTELLSGPSPYFHHTRLAIKSSEIPVRKCQSTYRIVLNDKNKQQLITQSKIHFKVYLYIFGVAANKSIHIILPLKLSNQLETVLTAFN